jgi:hypothetical protein
MGHLAESGGVMTLVHSSRLLIALAMVALAVALVVLAANGHSGSLAGGVSADNFVYEGS